MSEKTYTLEYNGSEKSFTDWGFEAESLDFHFVNQAVSMVRVELPGADPLGAEIFPFEAAVIVRQRAVNADGSPGDGVIVFQGVRLQEILEGSPESQGMTYQFGDFWYDLENTTYQMARKSYDAVSKGLVDVLDPDVVLFMNVSSTPTNLIKLNTGQQIERILQFVLDQYAAQGMAAPYVIGTIDVAVPVPTYPVRSRSCAECLQTCLKFSPDATVFADYSTTPPTVHVRQRRNLPAVTQTLANKVDHLKIKILRRSDLLARAVVLYFRQMNSANGQSKQTTEKQKFPLDGPEGGRRVVAQIIDLQGSSRTDVTGSIVATAVNPRGTAGERAAFWRLAKPEFASSKVRGIGFDYPTITDEATGEPVDLAAWPNLLADGCSLADWMKLDDGTAIVGIKVRILVNAQYDEYDVEGDGDDPYNATNGVLLREFESKQIHVSVTLTNGITGDYSALESSVSAEEVPEGMAEELYLAMVAPQYDGENIVLEQSASFAVGMGNVLNLAGGRAEWLAMNAQIQSVNISPGKFETRVAIGPAKHLGADDLTQIFLATRNRIVFSDPSMRSTSEGNSGRVNLGKTSSQMNTSHGLENKNSDTVTADAGETNKTVIRKDAATQSVTVQVFKVDGTVKEDAGQILLELSKANGKKIYVQEQNVCLVDGTRMKVVLLVSDPY